MTFNPHLLETLASYAIPLDNGHTLISEALVRKVPGKRYVCRGRYRSMAVYAKLFTGKRAQVHAARDLQGVRLLETAGILTPACLYTGSFEDGQVLVFEAIENSENTEAVWTRLKSSEERKALATSLVAEVGRHHRAGLIQQDLYLKNFLLCDDQLLTLDGDGIKAISAGSANTEYMQNLATLLSKFDLHELHIWLPDLMLAYAKAYSAGQPLAESGWTESHVFALAKRMRQDMIRTYAEKKVMRNCTDVTITKSLHQWSARANQATWLKAQPALQLPSALDTMLDGNTSRLKSGNTCTVASVQLAERRVVIKRYNIKSFWHGLSRGWRPSRAVISWQNAHRLQLAGFATAAPLQVLERRWGWWRRQSYFLMEHLACVDIADYFRDDQHSQQARTQMAEQLATLMYGLYQLGIAHGDCKSSNFLVFADRIHLIDLDAMRQTRFEWCAAKAHVRDLKRLLRNWEGDQETSSMIKEAFGRVYGTSAVYLEAIR